MKFVNLLGACLLLEGILLKGGFVDKVCKNAIKNTFKVTLWICTQKDNVLTQ